MKLCYKALLFSLLIYPGAGHYLLRQHIMGTVFAAIASVCLLVLFSRVMEIAQSISDRILSGEIPLDYMRIRAEISLGAITSGSTTVSVATWALVGCWLISSADAFRLGRRQQQVDQDNHAS